MAGHGNGGELDDEALAQEIALLADLIVAAGKADGPMDQAEIDELLGVSARPPAAQPKPTKKARPRRPGTTPPPSR
jgi:hypothetical protein